MSRYGLQGLNRLRSDLDRLFETAWGDVPAWAPSLEPSGGFPLLNVWEENDNLFVEAEMPGLDLSDLEIFVKEHQLTISGERKPVGEGEVAYHRRERGEGRFQRVLRLPFEIDADKVDARLENGVLLLTLPKAESAKPRKIKVNVG